MNYTNFQTSKFEKERYFKEIFLNNVDKYGLIISYLFIYLSNYLGLEYGKERGFYYEENLKKILLKYCLSSNYAIRPIPTEELIINLENITN